MKSKINKSSVLKERDVFVGYNHYPDNEDIYSRAKEESEIDPEDPTKIKAPIETLGKLNEKDFDEDESGSDLDIPGSELDDEMENVGSEDEENNYYSLGGDNNHDDIEKNDRD